MFVPSFGQNNAEAVHSSLFNSSNSHSTFRLKITRIYVLVNFTSLFLFCVHQMKMKIFHISGQSFCKSSNDELGEPEDGEDG